MRNYLLYIIFFFLISCSHNLGNRDPASNRFIPNKRSCRDLANKLANKLAKKSNEFDNKSFKTALDKYEKYLNNLDDINRFSLDNINIEKFVPSNEIEMLALILQAIKFDLPKDVHFFKIPKKDLSSLLHITKDIKFSEGITTKTLNEISGKLFLSQYGPRNVFDKIKDFKNFPFYLFQKYLFKKSINHRLDSFLDTLGLRAIPGLFEKTNNSLFKKKGPIYTKWSIGAPLYILSPFANTNDFVFKHIKIIDQFEKDTVQLGFDSSYGKYIKKLQETHKLAIHSETFFQLTSSLISFYFIYSLAELLYSTRETIYDLSKEPIEDLKKTYHITIPYYYNLYVYDNNKIARRCLNNWLGVQKREGVIVATNTKKYIRKKAYCQLVSKKRPEQMLKGLLEKEYNRNSLKK